MKIQTFQEECPLGHLLWNEYNKKLDEFFDYGENFLNKIIPELDERIENPEVDPRQIAMSLLSPGRGPVGNEPTTEYWRDNEDDLRKWLDRNHFDSFHEYIQREYELIQLLKELRERLLSKMRRYQEKYGVSVSY